MTEQEEIEVSKAWPRGLTVTGVRPITPAELEREGWDDFQGTTSVIVLSDGSVIYPSRDPEGNGPGALFGTLANGTSVYI